MNKLLLLFSFLSLSGCVNTAELYDFDGDGSLDSEDCAPFDSEIYPAAEDRAGDGLDSNCDGTDGVDSDADGFASLLSEGPDCNDDDPSIHPNAAEIADNTTDENCDGVILSCDVDGDGFPGDTPECSDEDVLSDCDDTDAAVAPGLEEICDGIDNNCDGQMPGEEDEDEDGYALCSGDCDDTDATTHAGAEEACDGLDNNCDAFIPLDELDVDGDSFLACEECDDERASIFPGAEEACDGVDSDCDGAVGEGTNGQPDESDGDADGDPACRDCDDVDSTLHHLDEDGDLVSTCGGDCNDSPAEPGAALIFPGAPDGWGDGLDANCDGVDGVDADGDGWAVNALVGTPDCLDDPATASASEVYPGALDPWGDGVDSNCDGADGLDADGDGFAANATGSAADCLDDPSQPSASFSFPGAFDPWGDGLDSNCDGVDGLDADGDGAAADAVGASQDCDDNDPDRFPGFPGWDPIDGVDNDCDGYPDRTRLSTADASLFGTLAQENSGQSVSSAGDVDGDDLDDLLIGAYTNNEGGSSAGKTYLMLGSTVAAGGSFDLSNADASFLGESAEDYSGQSVSSAGDVDGDGLDDLLIGAYGNDEGGSAAGKTYLMLGSTVSAGITAGSSTWSLSQADASFIGAEGGDFSGYFVSSAGDVDGDGLDDLLIGANYLMLGSTISAGLTVGTSTWSLSQADAFFFAEAPDDLPSRVSSAGDVDGDGLDDLLFGAPSSGFGNSAGTTYLMLGSTVSAGITAGSSTWNLGQADASFYGEAPGDQSGYSVAAGDIDGDGLSDLLIGARWNDEGGSSAGSTYLMLGSTVSAGITAGSSTWNLSQADASFIGESENDGSGGSVSSAGDVDGDDLDDLLIGAPAYWFGSGATYLMLGSTVIAGITAGNSTWNLSQADASFLAWLGSNDRSGCAVSSAGDVDGDGFDDLLIGASGNDHGGANGGATYLLKSSF